jgi:hypothetical protein
MHQTSFVSFDKLIFMTINARIAWQCEHVYTHVLSSRNNTLAHTHTSMLDAHHQTNTQLTTIWLNPTSFVSFDKLNFANMKMNCLTVWTCTYMCIAWPHVDDAHMRQNARKWQKKAKWKWHRINFFFCLLCNFTKPFYTNEPASRRRLYVRVFIRTTLFSILDCANLRWGTKAI